MPASRDGDVQTDNTDGRKFITIKVASNGQVAYRKIHLRTTNHRLARRRARALQNIDDPEEARRIIAYLASSRTPGQEADRLAELTDTMPTIPSLSHEKARKELEGIVCDFGDYGSGELDDEVVDRWRAAYSANVQRDLLIELGVPDDWLAENPDVFTQLKSRGRTVNPRYKPQHEAWAALFGLPADALKPDKPAGGPRLSKCIDEFRIEQEQRGNRRRHTNAYVNRFQVFVDLTRDKSVSRLTKSDFVKYVDKVLAEKKGASNKTIHDHLRPIGAVMRAARARMDDRVFPDGLDNWLTVLDRARIAKPYKPPRQNREPMPPDVFRNLLAQADQWAKVPWEEHAESLPVPTRGGKRTAAMVRASNRENAWMRQRIGVMTHSMLCLAANVGALPSDFARLQWDELELDGDLPLYREDRAKPAHRLGSDVPRCCPLLPVTVKSLRRWREWWEAELPEGEPLSANVFTHIYGGPIDQERSFAATKYLRRVRKAAGCDNWEVRHCRNIGATVVRDAHLPKAMADAWLGHAASGTNVFYTGEATEDYLLPLVDAIAGRYFA
jgi:integrase